MPPETRAAASPVLSPTRGLDRARGQGDALRSSRLFSTGRRARRNRPSCAVKARGARRLALVAVVAVFAGGCAPALPPASPSRAGIARAMRGWNRPVDPFRVIGNIYYVGTNELAIFLVTTPAGHFLIDSG